MAALLRRLFAQLAIRARRVHEDEEGGSMVFGTITLFALALFTVLVFHVGWNSGDRIQLQGAADAAAYSGALVEAEGLESIAFLNDGMAWVYYATLRYAVDAIVYSTLRAFHAHDEWVRNHESNRLNPVTEGPWMILDYSVQNNNPGARENSQYYIPPSDQGTMDYSFVEMGKGTPGDLFIGNNRRYNVAAGHAAYLIPRGKKWLADIHWAERIILAALPRMVERRAVLIGRMNGAYQVAVSDDLERICRLDQGSGGGPDVSGFSDGRTQGQSDRVDTEFANRYQIKDNPVDKKTRKLPSWFDAAQGSIAGGKKYSQVRLCWNKRDWDHSPEAPGKYGSHSPGFPQVSLPPNGHWHVLHAHNVDLIIYGYTIFLGPIYGANYDHDKGHGITSGDDAQDHQGDIVPGLPLQDPFYMNQGDLSAPTGTHHAAQRCPTCFAKVGEGRYTHVTHTHEDGKEFLEKDLASTGEKGPFTEVKFDKQGDTFPRPIRLKANAFRAGVAVACWRPGFSIGSIFRASPWGQLAVASAQVGVRNAQGVLMVLQQASGQSVTLSSFNGTTRTIQLGASSDGSGAPDNFYLGTGVDGDRGVRFGARLVPIARDESWAPTNGGMGAANAASQGLGALIRGKRWFQTGAPDEKPGNAPEALKELKLDVGKKADFFAH